MAAFEKLKLSLEATHLYSLQENSLVSAEISALGVAIDMFEEALQGLEKEGFVDPNNIAFLRNTATTLGLKGLLDEQLYGVLSILFKHRFHGVTANALQDIFYVLGFDTVITFDEQSKRTIISCTGENAADFSDSEAVKEILRLISFDENDFFVSNTLEKPE